ncbi:ABC transporter permease [Roseiconus nitratireducens]|uniref:Transport permease protein n=1 Tax=Roseiconus nitratireducens TaxID=2605748 RepID=A0A5M6D4K0_9BACT|nr:ABC transporter permease [Roseiconus nitratireducens]KAA5542273.1 ABC transporter permease [Roseiconus nitratireducens]
MFRLLALIHKEFLALLKDPKSRFVIVGPPIIQLLVFGYAATFDVTDVPLAVYNQSSGEASRDLVSRFEGSRNFRRVATITHDDQIAPMVDGRVALVVLHIGSTFSQDLHRKGRAKVQVILDGRDSNTALVTLGYARKIVGDFNVKWATDHGLGAAPAHLEARSWFNPNQQSRWFFVPGIVGLLTLVVTMLVTALSVAREREQGTFDQLLVTPYRPWEILVGKATPGFMIGIFEATVIITAAVFWFRVPLVGSLLTLYVGVVLFVFAAIGVGLMISSLAVTQQQALLGAFLFLVPAIILSGFSTPIANMPPAVQAITYANPLRYFLIVLRGVFLEGAPIRLLWHQLWPMAAIAAITLTSAAWLFRRRMS